VPAREASVRFGLAPRLDDGRGLDVDAAWCFGLARPRPSRTRELVDQRARRLFVEDRSAVGLVEER
jgi:hypothetical protein